MGYTSNRGCLWQLSHSMWVLWSFFFMPCMGFFIIGKRLNHRPWFIWAGIYLIGMVITFSLVDSPYKDYGLFKAFLIVYTFGGIAHTFIVRSEYLQRLAAFEDDMEEFYRRRDNGYGVEKPRTENVQQFTAQPSSAPIDINSCSFKEMADLPGIGVVEVKKAMEYRSEHGGFTSFDEFVKVLQLKPHFVVQLQDLVTCGPMYEKPMNSQSGKASSPEDSQSPKTDHHGLRLDL